MSDKTFPREVVISPGYGAGIASWNDDAHDVVEHPITIAAAKEGVDQYTVEQRLIDAGVISKGDSFYWGGWDDAKVVTVNGPYYIDEYDGSESIIEQCDSDIWRT